MTLPNTMVMNLCVFCGLDLVKCYGSTASTAEGSRLFKQALCAVSQHVCCTAYLYFCKTILNYHERGITSGLEIRCKMMFLHHVHRGLGNTLPRLILHPNLTDHMIHSLTTCSGCTTRTQIHNAKQMCISAVSCGGR